MIPNHSVYVHTPDTRHAISQSAAPSDPPALYRAPLPYFGSVALWRAAVLAGGFRFRENEHYQRRTQRNRCAIATAQGRQTLSVPLLAGKHERCRIREVRIAYAEDWRTAHWRTLVAAYGSAPFWNEYRHGLAPLFGRQPDLLWDWNYGLVQWVATELRSGLVLAEAADWQPTRDTRREPLGPDPTLPPYPQVFAERTGFLSNLSVLDLLMCRGPAATDYLSA